MKKRRAARHPRDRQSPDWPNLKPIGRLAVPGASPLLSRRVEFATVAYCSRIMMTPEPSPHFPRRVLGVEGGGTKTEWALLDENGCELRGGALPAANLRLITDADLLSLLGILPVEATHVGIFLAGCADAADRRRLETLVQRVWPAA